MMCFTFSIVTAYCMPADTRRAWDVGITLQDNNCICMCAAARQAVHNMCGSCAAAACRQRSRNLGQDRGHPNCGDLTAHSS